MLSRRDALLGLVGAGTAAVITSCGRSDAVSTGTTPSTAAAPASATSRPRTLDSIAAATEPADRGTTTSLADEPWTGADFGSLDAYLAETNGEAFAICERGVLVHEWYRTDATYRRDIASCQKSVLSLLVGRAIDETTLTLETGIDEVLGPTWADGSADTSAITVRDLLSMTSGLDNRYDTITDAGEQWLYSGAFAALFDVVEQVTDGTIVDVGRRWLFDPIGAADADFYERPAANRFAPIGLRATARDLISIAEVVLGAGLDVVSSDWLDASLAASQSLNPAYGLLWWLNGTDMHQLPGQPEPQPGPLIPSAPRDLVAALGKDDQKVYISRSLDLTVVRLGGPAIDGAIPALSGFDDDLWSRLTELRTPR